MKVKTVVVSNYPMFKAGLKKVLDENFTIVASFSTVSELLDAKADAKLAILDEQTARERHLLQRDRPDITILMLSLEYNTGHIYESTGGISNPGLINAIWGLAVKLSFSCHRSEYQDSDD